MKRKMGKARPLPTSPMLRGAAYVPVLLILCGSCQLSPRDPNVTGPEPNSDLSVAAIPSSSSVFESATAELTADVSGGMQPYYYRWTQNVGPVDVAIEDDLTVRATTAELTDIGRYVFRVVVTDAAGAHATGFAAVEVLSLANVTAPDFVIVGEAGQLTAGLQNAPAGTTVEWHVIEGSASLGNPTSATPTLTANAPGTIKLRADISTTAGSGGPNVVSRELSVVAVKDLKPRVLIETSNGNFTLELNGEAAPHHMANFLRYADAGFYNGLLVHRVACSNNASGGCDPFVIQTGGYERVNGELTERKPLFDPIAGEPNNGLSNGTLYSVALALSTGPDTGSAQFFINMNASNGFLDARGFTVFGQVLDGTDVLDAIAQVTVEENPVLSGEKSLPVDDVVVTRMSRVD